MLPLILLVLLFQAPPQGRSDSLTADIAIDAEDHFFVVGNFLGTASFGEDGKFTVTSKGATDAFVAHYDDSGTCQWVLDFGGTGADEAQALELTPDGALVVSGLFVGEVDFDPSDGTKTLKTEGTSAEQFLARYTREGTLDWVVRLGKRVARTGIKTADRGESNLACDEQGNIYVVGATPVPGSDGAGPHGSMSARGHGVVVKFDPKGKEIWSKRIGDDGEMVFPIGVAAVGEGCAVGGFVDFSVSEGGGTPQRRRAMHLSAFDGKGDPLWSRRWDGAVIDSGVRNGIRNTFRSHGQVCALATDGKGSIYATGWMRGTIDLDPDKNTKGDTLRAEGAARLGFVLRVDAKGTFRGAFEVKVAGPGELDDSTTGADCRAIMVAKDGIRVAGHRASHQDVKGRKWSLSNSFVSKYKKNGKLAWSRIWDTKKPVAWNQGLSAVMGSDSRVLLAGFGGTREGKQIVATQGARGFVLGFNKSGKPLKAKKKKR